jgi:Outer membrane protein Omp28
LRLQLARAGVCALLLLAPALARAQCAERTALLEVFTGAWAGFAPDGAVRRDEVLAAAAGRAIAVDIHSADGMATAESEELTAFYAVAQPTGVVDRLDAALSRTAWQGAVDAELAADAPVAISVRSRFDEATRTLSGRVRAEFVCAASGELGFLVLVVEDHVTGLGTGFDQVNYYDAVAGHPFEGAGDPIVGYDHRYVLRAAPLGAFGSAGAIPASVGPGERFEQTFSYTVPTELDATQLRVVGAVVRMGTAVNQRTVLNATAAAPEPPPDPFLAYAIRRARGAAKPPRFGPVTLADAFRTADYDVGAPRALLLPADVDGQGRRDETTHLEEYKVAESRGTAHFQVQREVHVTNACSDLQLEVKRPISLLVPTSKSLAGAVEPPDPASHLVDHFLCYAARPQKRLADGTRPPPFRKGVQVDVEDQFQVRRYDLLKVTKLCNPVAKSGSPVILSGAERGNPKPIEPALVGDPDSRLVCYRARRARRLVPQDGCGPAQPTEKGPRIEPRQPRHERRRGIQLANQFGSEQVDSVGERELCVPSQRVDD